MERAGPGGADHVEMPGPIQMIIYRARFTPCCPIPDGPLALSLRKESGGACRRESHADRARACPSPRGGSGKVAHALKRAASSDPPVASPGL
jgi:hypothetical protein